MANYTTPPLRPVHGKNRWCGPAVVSAVTGRSTDEVSKVIRDATGRMSVTYTTRAELRAALNAFGFDLSGPGVDERRNRTLARWLAERQDRRKTYVVAVTGHWMVVRGNKVVDSFNREPTNLRSVRGRRRRVKKWWPVYKANYGSW